MINDLSQILKWLRCGKYLNIQNNKVYAWWCSATGNKLILAFFPSKSRLNFPRFPPLRAGGREAMPSNSLIAFIEWRLERFRRRKQIFSFPRNVFAQKQNSCWVLIHLRKFLPLCIAQIISSPKERAWLTNKINRGCNDALNKRAADG